MDIKIRHTGSNQFVEVIVCVDSTQTNLGLLNEDERRELAEKFINAAHEIGPRFYAEATPWFWERVAECGIDIPNASLTLSGDAGGGKESDETE
jgi:hypothetical protein